MFFLEHHNQKKCGPNLTAIASQGMPSGSGRKSGVAKRKRSRVAVPVETRSVRQCLQNPIDECTYATSSTCVASSLIPSVLPTPSLTATLAFGRKSHVLSTSVSDLLRTCPKTAASTSTLQQKHGGNYQIPLSCARQTNPLSTTTTSALERNPCPSNPCTSGLSSEPTSIISIDSPICTSNTIGLVLKHHHKPTHFYSTFSRTSFISC